jgi:SAM-dependent methyltransferase
MELERLRGAFDEDAELYDRARPSYPADLVDELVALTGIGPDSRVLEVGPGTGQLTVPIAERGSEIVAVELGSRMAAVAQRNLARFPSAVVVVAAFEDWPLPPSPFDLVVSATAWHWIDPAVRVTKAADALRPDGALAVATTHHIAGGTDDFWGEVQECYERWDPATESGLRLPATEQIPAPTDEMDASGRFESATLRRYERDIAYSTNEYLDTLLTYSGHRALESQRRAALLDCIARLIDARYGGKIVKRHLHQLVVAHRRAC